MQGRNPILVVEDDAPVRELIAEVLRDAGYEVVECSSGLEALSQLQAQAVALITLDLAMPNMDGIQFLSALRERPETASVPVIAVTAAVENVRAQLTEQVRATVGKPFHLDHLIGVVARTLEEHQPVR